MTNNFHGLSNVHELNEAVAEINRQIVRLHDSGFYPKAIPKLRASLAELEGCVARLGRDAGQSPHPT
jgi:hypothetical protein